MIGVSVVDVDEQDGDLHGQSGDEEEGGQEDEHEAALLELAHLLRVGAHEAARDERVFAYDLDDDGVRDDENGCGQERVGERVERLEPCQVEPCVLEYVQAEAAVVVLTLENVIVRHN